MFSNTSNGLTPADVMALNGNGNGFGDGSWLWFIIVIFCVFGGFGNGFGNNSGTAENYTLASDFATLQRQLDTATDRLATQTNQIANGLSSLGYDQLGQFNGINQNVSSNAYNLQTAINTNGYDTRTAITTGANAIQSQLATCCCENKAAIADLNYNMAMANNATQQAVSNGFCQTNYNNATNTRDIVDNANAGTQAILAKLADMESSAKDEKIADQQAKINALQLAASQQAQNNYIVSQLRPAPIPAYTVANPYNYYYGTTIG